MYFKNKKTGVTWHITNKLHQKRLERDTSYIVVSNTNVQENNENGHKTSKNDLVLTENEIKSLKWNELRSLASEKGINVRGAKREDIEAELIKRVDLDE